VKLTCIACRRIGLVSGELLGSNCRTRGPGVKRNLSVTGFWGGVEPQRVDRRQLLPGDYFRVARQPLTIGVIDVERLVFHQMLRNRGEGVRFAIRSAEHWHQ